MTGNTSAIFKIAKQFREGMLNREPSTQMCFALCSALVGYLDFAGYQCSLTKGVVGNWEHYWLTLPDGTIIDPTADQFTRPDGAQMPLVFSGERPEWYKLIPHKG